MFGKEVDMIADDHQVADRKVGVGATRRVGDEQRADAQFAHHADGERYFLHGITLIEVKAALHGHDVLPSQPAEDQLAAVSFHGGNREMGNIFVIDFISIRYLIGQAAQARAQDDGSFGCRMHPPPKEVCGFLNDFVHNQ